MIYQGGAWPAEYRGQMFMGNIHGHRLNMDILKPKGSGFVASHGPDFLLANDAWARFINLQLRPRRQRLPHRLVRQASVPRRQQRGRLGPHQRPHLQDQLSRHEAGDRRRSEPRRPTRSWSNCCRTRTTGTCATPGGCCRSGRRTRRWSTGTHEVLAKIAFEHKDETRRLRGLWALHATGGLTEERMLKALSDECRRTSAPGRFSWRWRTATASDGAA